MPIIFWLTLFLLSLPILANNCIQDPGQAPAGQESILPRNVGSPKARNMRPYEALCDTMFVRKGDTSTVYAGTLFHFSRPEFRNRHVIVHGYLQLLGDPGLPVSMAGSITDTGVVIMAGGEKWGGIRVMPEGQFEARYALITAADTALDIQSKKTRIGRMLFQDCNLRINEDRTFNSLEAPKDSMVVWNGPDAKRSMPNEKSRWNKPSTYLWAGGAIGVAGLGGTLLWIASRDKGTNVTPPGEIFPNDPNSPQGGGRN